jgi:hypothetical protein
MDSDDAIHKGWLAAVKAAPTGAEVCCTRNFLRYDILAGKLCAYSRREPSPLAAFKGGRNPFAHDHAELERRYRVHDIAGPYLVQIFHGGNVSSRRPPWYRRRLPSSASRITASVESSLMAHPEQVIESSVISDQYREERPTDH